MNDQRPPLESSTYRRAFPPKTSSRPLAACGKKPRTRLNGCCPSWTRRVAYRLVRDAKIGGFIELEGERKRVRDFSQGRLSIELFAADGLPPRSADFSQLRIRYGARRVFQIRWDDDGRFKAVHYEPSDWERTLTALAS
jgi:hypothetical protein